MTTHDDMVKRLKARSHDHRHSIDNTGTWPVPIRNNELEALTAEIERLREREAEAVNARDMLFAAMIEHEEAVLISDRTLIDMPKYELRVEERRGLSFGQNGFHVSTHLKDTPNGQE